MNSLWPVPPLSPPPDVKILWDYTTQQVVDGGNVSCGLFDTHWTYTYRADSRLPWVLTRCPGEVLYLQEREVPELVRMAVMVAS